MKGTEEKLPAQFTFDDIMRIRVKPFVSQYFWHLLVGWIAIVIGSYFVIDEWQKRRNKI